MKKPLKKEKLAGIIIGCVIIAGLLSNWIYGLAGILLALAGLYVSKGKSSDGQELKKIICIDSKDVVRLAKADAIGVSGILMLFYAAKLVLEMMGTEFDYVPQDAALAYTAAIVLFLLVLVISVLFIGSLLIMAASQYYGLKSLKGKGPAKWGFLLLFFTGAVMPTSFLAILFVKAKAETAFGGAIGWLLMYCGLLLIVTGARTEAGKGYINRSIERFWDLLTKFFGLHMIGLGLGMSFGTISSSAWLPTSAGLIILWFYLLLLRVMILNILKTR